MTSRFVSNVLVLIAAAVVVAFSLVFRPAVLGWIGLGVAGLVVVVVLAAFPARGRGVAQRIIDSLTALAGGCLIVGLAVLQRRAPEVAHLRDGSAARRARRRVQGSMREQTPVR